MPYSPGVLVVGGGAAGVIAAAALLDVRAGAARHAPFQVSIVERAATVGPGLAYGVGDERLLLNNYANRMSALATHPDDLLEWCADNDVPAHADSFLPRRTYGAYLAGLLDRVPHAPGSSLTRVRGVVVDVVDLGTGYLASLADGRVLEADAVVLALGNPPPRRPWWTQAAGDVYAGDPWDEQLPDRVGRRGRVLLVGTGLTMVDVAARVAATQPSATMTAVSRRGLLPRVHRERDLGPAAPFEPPADDLRSVVAYLRGQTGAADWRVAVESVKSVGNDVWSAWTFEEQRQFVRHLGRYWEVLRHRMAPAMAHQVDGLLAEGRLRVARPEAAHLGEHDLVVNCTGPAPAVTPGWNPLVDRLAASGSLRPGPHGLGLDVDRSGALRDAAGATARGVFVMGAARRGVEWEVAAVPDLRRQASVITHRLRSRPDGARGTDLSASSVATGRA